MVNCDFFGVANDVQGKVLVKAADNPEETIVRACKWSFMAVMLHMHVGGCMEIRRQINSLKAVPSCRNKLEVLH